MGQHRLSRLLLTAGFLLAPIAEVSAAESDPFAGTWTLDIAKSLYKPGPAPQSLTLHYEILAQGPTATFEATNAEGRRAISVYPMIADEKPHAVTGSNITDATAIKRVDAHTLQFTNTRTGMVVATGTLVLSDDGKVLTLSSKGTGPQPFENLQVYDRR